MKKPFLMYDTDHVTEDEYLARQEDAVFEAGMKGLALAVIFIALGVIAWLVL